MGEVEFRGPSVVAGYWNDPEATAAAISPDGWLATGRRGCLDEDGYLFLVDRKKELMIRGGYNVYPREVEEALYAHPDVLEAAVVGVPHDQLGEEVAAVVVRRPGAAADAEELKAWAKERVAAYKYPRIVAFVDELPKGADGKDSQARDRPRLPDLTASDSSPATASDGSSAASRSATRSSAPPPKAIRGHERCSARSCAPSSASPRARGRGGDRARRANAGFRPAVRARRASGSGAPASLAR